jgi:hypothetical protein
VVREDFLFLDFLRTTFDYGEHKGVNMVQAIEEALPCNPTNRLMKTRIGEQMTPCAPLNGHTFIIDQFIAKCDAFCIGPGQLKSWLMWHPETPRLTNECQLEINEYIDFMDDFSKRT